MIIKLTALTQTIMSHDVFAGLWAVVNNAGISFPGMIEWQTVEEMKRVVDVNVWGMVSVTRAFLPLLRRTKGRVVNIASCLGRVAIRGAAAYCISKFSVQAFSDTLRREMRHFGVTVHIIEPGFFKTNITDTKTTVQCIEALWENLDANTKESYGIEFFEKGNKIYLIFISRWSLLDSPCIGKRHRWGEGAGGDPHKKRTEVLVIPFRN